MNWINVVVVLLLTILATEFALSNLENVHVAFGTLRSGTVPLFLPVFIAFLLGFAGGMLSLAFSRRKHKEEIRRLRHENAVLQKEIDNLRNLPLQDEA